MLDKTEVTFPYTKLTVKPFPGSKRQSAIYRPIIPVTIIYRKKLIVFQALIDSGADYNIFHGDIAAYLGINLTKGFFDKFKVNFNLKKLLIHLNSNK